MGHLRFSECIKKTLLIRLILALILVAGFKVASADVVVIVNPDNPISALSKKDVQRLFLGRMHEFPNSNMKVEAIDSDEGSKEYESFYANIIKMSRSKLKRYRAYFLFSGKGRLPLQLNSSNKIVNYIATHKNAIAYIDRSEISNKVKVVYPDLN